MRLTNLTLGVVALALGGAATAHAQQPTQPSGQVYAVTYFEVSPSAAGETAALARQYAAVSRKEPGNAGFDALEEIARPGRFATLEAWQDKSAADAHAAAAKTFEAKLQAELISPFDVRLSSGLSIAAPKAQPGADAVYVLTHVDVVPAGKDETQQLAEALAAAARAEPGNLWFDVLQQANRPNHFTLVEGWRNRDAFATHIDTPSTRQFRNKLTPLQGALYDERLYRAVR
ncbi:MAG: antibiotic biosynthesis monooxygenase [Stellaceae bacterium]